LNRIFADSGIIKPNKPWQYWLPVLGLYTGARLNELCQLRIIDIKNHAGIWYFDFTDEGVGQHLKSTSSKRRVPVHSDIISLGFLEYVETAKKANRPMLFDLPIRNDRYSHTPSKWFNRIKSRALSEHDKKAFHSFRHTFIDYALNKLKLQGNPLLKALVGHTDKEITSGVYGSSFELEDLNNIIQQIDFQTLSVNILPVGT
jgi:integrase